MNKVRYFTFLGVMLALTLSSSYAFQLGLEIQKEQSDFEKLDEQINSQADLMTDSDGFLYEKYDFDYVSVLLSRSSSQRVYPEEQGLLSGLLFDPSTNAKKAMNTHRRIYRLWYQKAESDQAVRHDLQGSGD